MKKKIIEYLQGPRLFSAGVELYNMYGWNVHLKRAFARQGETDLNKKVLLEELRKLAGLSEEELKNVKRISVSQHYTDIQQDGISVTEKKKYDDDIILELADSLNTSVDELLSGQFADRIYELEETEERIVELEDQLEEVRNRYDQAPEPVIKMIRFREKFPFLSSPDCPDILKILVSDMFTTYDIYKESYEQLQEFPDNADISKTAELAKTTVENFISNREMWEELEYYASTGNILGKCDRVKQELERQEITKMSDMDLATAINNARANISKNKKKAKSEDPEKRGEAEILINKWTVTRDAIAAEIEYRKKK